jgi:hypothetical protein
MLMAAAKDLMQISRDILWKTGTKISDNVMRNILVIF